MTLRKRFFCYFLFATVLSGCLEPYAPPSGSSPGNYLVVDGYLDAGSNSCTISLSRSISLSEEIPLQVNDAIVLLEDENGNSFPLVLQDPAGSNSVYSVSNLLLDVQKSYRIHITSQGKAYASDFVPIVQPQVIDTVGWTVVPQPKDDANVTLYVSAHGADDQSRYYRWDTEETWQYTARYPWDLKFENGQVVPNFDSTYYCWRTINSTSILINSTTQFAKNVVDRFELASVPVNSVKFFRGYSILVKQLSITKEAFEYWQQLKATTENLGTIFGPQPTQFSGNIHSITNPLEPVFGYFSAAAAARKRIFIQPAQLPPPSSPVITGYENCTLDTLKINDLIYYHGGSVFVSSYGIGPLGYVTTSIECVDCRLMGGTIVKPDFWK